MRSNLLYLPIPKKNRENGSIPKRHLLDENFWFVNAGILPNSIYDKSTLFVGTYPFASVDFSFILFLGLKYLIHYIELFIFDNTPLLTECINKHLKYLQTILGTQKKSRKLLSYEFIVKMQFIFNNLQNFEVKNFACRQVYIDQLERFCNLFTGRLNIWIKNPVLQAYLFRYGYDPCRSSVIYNSFLIPNQKRYVDPLCRVDQRFIEKIEIKCKCKIMLSVESIECFLYPEYITLEVMFDLYRGNYVGFIEMFGYIVKRLNPNQYFAKSLRTVIIEGSTLYNILTNVPVRKLKYLEKTVIAGCPVTPFLSPESSSKQLLSIVAKMIPSDPAYLETMDNETTEYSDDVLNDLDLQFGNKKYYTHHSTATEFNRLQDDLLDINESQKLLKYFQVKYDRSIQEIQFEKEIKKQNVKNLLQMQDKTGPLMPKGSSFEEKSEVFEAEKNETHFSIIYKPATEDSENHRENSNVINNSKKKKENNHVNSTGRFSGKANQTQRYLNESNICMVHKGLISNSEFDFDVLEPIDQFKLLLQQNFKDYSNEDNWINHKIRLMLKCDTDSTVEDAKFPYVYQKVNIKDRLTKKPLFRNKYPRPRGISRTYTTKKVKKKITQHASKHSWMSKTASRILSDGILSAEDVESKTSSSLSETEIFSGDDLRAKFPQIFLFLEKYGGNIIDIFINKKLYKKQDWLHFLSKQFHFNLTKDVTLKRICDFDTIFKSVCERNSKKLQIYEDTIVQRIYALLLLLTNEAITEKEFHDLVNGKGVSIPLIDEVNKTHSSVPTYIGNLESYRNKDYLGNLSRCLCQMMYDLIHIAHESSQDVFFILKMHIQILDDIIKNIEDKDILAAFNILSIREELNSLNFNTYIRGYGPNASMILMAEELSFLHDIIFKQPCCSYKLSNHLGLHIIYHSLRLDNNLNVVEPFFKLPGDRRIKKIEKICNCLIALRTQKHPTISIDEYLVDIYYDFDTGNHFGAIDLLKQMMSSQNRLLAIQDHRTIVAYPSGELWVFREADWLKKCYNLNDNELKNLDIFRKKDDKNGVLRNFDDDIFDEK